MLVSRARGKNTAHLSRLWKAVGPSHTLHVDGLHHSDVGTFFNNSVTFMLAACVLGKKKLKVIVANLYSSGSLALAPG